MLPADWIPHRRDDGELLGWIRPEGDDWVAVDLLGREASAAVDWLEAESALEANGLSWLADVWVLDLPEGDAVRGGMARAADAPSPRAGRAGVDAFRLSSTPGCVRPGHRRRHPASRGNTTRGWRC